MKKVHIISLGDTYMFRLAVALREKGYLKQAPDVLNIGDEANPVGILYTFKIFCWQTYSR